MQCHKAGALPEEEGRKFICQGWIRVMGLDAIGVRIALMTRLVTPEEAEDREGLDLFSTFREMLEANKVTPPRRNRVVPIRRRTR